MKDESRSPSDEFDLFRRKVDYEPRLFFDGKRWEPRKTIRTTNRFYKATNTAPTHQHNRKKKR